MKHQNCESNNTNAASRIDQVYFGDSARPTANVEILAAGDEPLTIRRRMLSTSELNLVHLRVDGPNIRRGALPPGHSFGLTEYSGAPSRWCGHIDDGRSICRFPREFEAISTTQFDGVCLTFSEDLFGSMADLQELGVSPSSRASMLEVDEVRLSSIRQMLRTLEELGCNVFDTSPDNIETLTQDLCSSLVSAVGKSFTEKTRPPLNSRCRSFQQAVRYIEENLGEKLTLKDICTHTGVSARTLEYAFQESVGTSPMAYTKSRRLDRVHRDLEQRRCTGDSIADIANRWGFWHMGQFAADFRRLFGVRPRDVGVRLNDCQTFSMSRQ